VLDEETELRKRIARELLSEILVPIEVEGPCGKVEAYGVIDTGASTQMLMPEVLEKTCMWGESKGTLIVASGDTIETRRGKVKLKVGEGNCPEVDVWAFEGPFNLIGMEYLVAGDAQIDTRRGRVFCRVEKD
jgi:predicted aspartyl protease